MLVQIFFMKTISKIARANGLRLKNLFVMNISCNARPVINLLILSSNKLEQSVQTYLAKKKQYCC